MEQNSLARRAWLVTFVWFCFIVYVSLYPWRFGPRIESTWVVWNPIAYRGDVMDVILNIWLYVPWGAAAYVALRGGGAGWTFGILGGAVLSFSMEILQMWVPGRFTNMRDLTANSLGSAVGVVLAYVGTRPSLRSWWDDLLPGWKMPREGAMLLGMWAVWQCFPFFPVLHFSKAYEVVERLLRFSGTWLEAGQAFAAFLILALAVGRSTWIAGALAIYLVQGLLRGHMFSPRNMLAAILAWGLAQLLVNLRMERFVGLALLAWIVVDELRPFVWNDTATEFGWIPFGGVFQKSDPYPGNTLQKLFMYTGTIWALRRIPWNLPFCTGLLVLILAVAEWMQRHIPDRTPETTDAVVALAGGILLAMIAERRTHTRAATVPFREARL